MRIQDSYRDQEWLENMLAEIWLRHFFDVDQKNQVFIRYGRRAKNRLGSISLHPKNPEISVITINSIYQDLEVPEFVVKATIVHELIHYAHGFHSPHYQKHRYPHSGGVIRHEFTERGLEDLYLKQRDWLKKNWHILINRYFPNQTICYNRRTTIVKAPWWFRV